jgi:hypothetical protein
VDGALQNHASDFGGVQLTAQSTGCSARGETVGQDLNIDVDLLVPTDDQLHVTEAGVYFRSRSAFSYDGIIGGDSAGYWVELKNTGVVIVKNLHSGLIVASTEGIPSFDNTVFHHLAVNAQRNILATQVDGQLQTFIQNGLLGTQVVIPETGGSNDGTVGIAFGAEFNRGQAGGQRAVDLVVSDLAGDAGTSGHHKPPALPALVSGPTGRTASTPMSTDAVQTLDKPVPPADAYFASSVNEAPWIPIKGSQPPQMDEVSQGIVELAATDDLLMF